MANSILIPLSDSTSSRAVINFISNLAFCPEDAQITLLHLFRKPSASEELMGKKFTAEMPSKAKAILERAKDNLVESGFNPNNIKISLVTDFYTTIADGIIDQCNKQNYDLIIIGRKHMSKAEEFVRGDVSVRLIRALQGSAVLVVKAE
ncbi:MAG: universal stress protein [Desulfatiglandaceae bacterium]